MRQKDLVDMSLPPAAKIESTIITDELLTRAARKVIERESITPLDLGLLINVRQIVNNAEILSFLERDGIVSQSRGGYRRVLIRGQARFSQQFPQGLKVNGSSKNLGSPGNGNGKNLIPKPPSPPATEQPSVKEKQVPQKIWYKRKRQGQEIAINEALLRAAAELMIETGKTGTILLINTFEISMAQAKAIQGRFVELEILGPKNPEAVREGHQLLVHDLDELNNKLKQPVTGDNGKELLATDDKKKNDKVLPGEDGIEIEKELVLPILPALEQIGNLGSAEVIRFLRQCVPALQCSTELKRLAKLIDEVCIRMEIVQKITELAKGLK